MDAHAYPFKGNPRVFRAVAMPNGDAHYGIEGPLVFLCEQRGHCQDRPKFLSLAEARQLHAALGQALGTFAVGAALAEDGDRPRAYTGPFPIRGPSLAEVDALAQGEAA